MFLVTLICEAMETKEIMIHYANLMGWQFYQNRGKIPRYAWLAKLVSSAHVILTDIWLDTALYWFIHQPWMKNLSFIKKINWRHISRELKSIEGSIRVVNRQKEIKFLCKHAMGSSANKIAVKIPYIVTWATNVCFALCTLHICCFNCW